MNVFQNKYSSKRFLATFTLFCFVFLFLIGLLSYAIDPFFQFRVGKMTYLLNPRLVNGGVAKHYDYNTVVLGSSMVQNYNLNILRQKDASIKPVKLSSGGMNVLEMEYLYSFVNKENTNAFIINLDISQFNNAYGGIRYPEYLYDDGIMNKLEYLYGYETLIHFIPVDVGLTLYMHNKKDVSLEYRIKTSLDDMGNTSLQSHFGSEQVRKLYLSGQTVSYQDLNNMVPRMQNQLDTMLARMEIEKYKNIDYTFVLSPYSALYWYHTQQSGYYTQFLDFVSYLTQTTQKYPNVRIACFFDIEEITNLDNYTDVTHFSPTLSDKVLKEIDNPEYELNTVNVDRKRQRIDSLVNAFAENNKNWLHK